MKRWTAIGSLSLGILLSVGEANAALISYWAAEGDATDSVGPNSGTLVGATFAPGVIGQAFHFDGSSYVTAPTAGLPTGAQDRTIDLWFQVDSYAEPPDEYFALAAGYGAFGADTQAYILGVYHYSIIFGPQGDRVTWTQWGSGVAGGPAIQTGTWHNLGVTTSGNFATLYLDGNVVATGTVPFDTPAGTDFVIGRIPGVLGDVRNLVGLVDEVRVYDTALSAAEMQALAMIPEPGAGLLVMTGLLGLAALRRRRR